MLFLTSSFDEVKLTPEAAFCKFFAARSAVTIDTAIFCSEFGSLVRTPLVCFCAAPGLLLLRVTPTPELLVTVLVARFVMTGALVAGFTVMVGLGWMSLPVLVLTLFKGDDVIVTELGRIRTCCWGTMTGAIVAVPGSTIAAGEVSG